MTYKLYDYNVLSDVIASSMVMDNMVEKFKTFVKQGYFSGGAGNSLDYFHHSITRSVFTPHSVNPKDMSSAKKLCDDSLKKDFRLPPSVDRILVETRMSRWVRFFFSLLVVSNKVNLKKSHCRN